MRTFFLAAAATIALASATAMAQNANDTDTKIKSGSKSPRGRIEHERDEDHRRGCPGEGSGFHQSPEQRPVELERRRARHLQRKEQRHRQDPGRRLRQFEEDHGLYSVRRRIPRHGNPLCRGRSRSVVDQVRRWQQGLARIYERDQGSTEVGARIQVWRSVDRQPKLTTDPGRNGPCPVPSSACAEERLARVGPLPSRRSASPAFSSPLPEQAENE